MQRRRLEGHGQAGAIRRGRHIHLGLVLRDLAARGIQHVGIAHAHFNGVARAAHAAVADVFLAQQHANVAGRGVQPLGDGRAHVYLEHEMHAAAQIQPQIHGLGVQRRQPVRRAGDQIERHDVGAFFLASGQGARNHVLGLDLRVFGIKARAHRLAVKHHAVSGNARFLQSLLHLLQRLAIHLDGHLACGHLHRRRFAIQVGQGVDHADEQRHGNQRVFPERVAVHANSLLMHKSPQTGAAGEENKGGQADSGGSPRQAAYFSDPLGSTCTTAWRCTCTCTPSATSSVRWLSPS